MLIVWSLASSDTVKSLINQSYKQNRHEDDLNQPRSVQPWGSDGDKRRYFLIEGQDDTAFRVYRESNPAGNKRTWWSVAGSIEELTALADKLEKEDGGPKAKKLSNKMLQAIPRFEAGEEVWANLRDVLVTIFRLHGGRNGNVVNTVNCARNSSSGLNQASPCTKAVHEERR